MPRRLPPRPGRNATEYARAELERAGFFRESPWWELKYASYTDQHELFFVVVDRQSRRSALMRMDGQLQEPVELSRSSLMYAVDYADLVEQLARIHGLHR